MNKIHLGCGEVYLAGYINIDFPSSNHSVQKKSVADKYADITKLKYKKNSIDEVRLHHVYEHFSRAQAVALLLSWRSWLKENGIIRIEVPDFNKCAFVVLNPFSSRNAKSVALRHIFGSNEKFWAVHFEGHSLGRLSELLMQRGFTIKKRKKTKYLGTYNIEILAHRNAQVITKREAKEIGNNYLKKYLIDFSKSERKLLQIWLNDFEDQLEKSWAK